MNIYTIVKFLHIAGAMAFFMALGLEWLSLRQLRAAVSANQVREWMRITSSARRLAGASMLAILIAGFYMMAAAKMGAAWVMVGFWSLVLLGLLSAILTGRPLGAIRRAVQEANGPASTLSKLTHDARLWLSIRLRVSIALGVVFIMTVKPGLGVSLLSIGIAILLGLASALPLPGRERPQKELAQRTGKTAGEGRSY